MLAIKYNFGDKLRATEDERLLRQLDDAYTDTALVVNTKVSKIVANTDPLSNNSVNKNFEIGDIWVNQTGQRVYMMTDRATASNVTWTKFIG